MSHEIVPSPLRTELESHGLPLTRLTVLAAQNDPFRVDTPAGHRDGAWLASCIADLGLADRTIHLRGLHYALIGLVKPNDKPYTNTDSDWTWLQNTASKAARWLGYVPFDRIVDQRNAAPVVRVHEDREPWPVLSVGVSVDIPDVDEIEPVVFLHDFNGRQPYRIVMYGEKSSLEPVLGRVAQRFDADLYLPTGEISDTLMHTMAESAAVDGRPMVVLTFSDCDPAGWQMPISIARKLQAFKTALYPEIEFQVRRVALTPDLVKTYGLPSTPLKATEKRAGKWVEAMRVEQTEIDALASLRPELLEEIAAEAVEPFYDSTLKGRVLSAQREWDLQAQERLQDAVGAEQMAAFRAEAEDKLTQAQDLIDALNESLRVDASDLDLPEIVVPLAMMPAPPADPPLIDSSWGFVEQCQSLIDSKRYGGDPS